MTVLSQYHNRRPWRGCLYAMLSCLCLLGVAGRGAGQDLQPADRGGDPVALETASLEELVREFDAAIAQWKEVTAAMFEQMFLWHSDAQQKSDAEEKRLWAQRESEGRALQDRAFRVATEIMRRDPGAHPPASGFLLSSLGHRDRMGWREGTGEAADAVLGAGIELLRSLESAGLSAADLHLIAGRGYFATSQFEKAEPHLKAAVRAGKGNELDAHRLDSIEEFARRQQQDAARRQTSEAEDLPRVRLMTSRGEIVVELFEDDAPNTVANFIALVEDGFYNGSLFYQVLKDMMALTGDPAGDGSGTAGFRIPDETRGLLGPGIERGSLVMAKLPDPSSPPEVPRTIPDSASSQFFIALGPIHPGQRELTVFGRVIDGIRNVSALTQIDIREEKQARSTVPDQILEAEVLWKRDHPYVPRRL